MSEAEDLNPETVLRQLNIAAQAVFRASNRLKSLSEELDGKDGELGVGTRYDIAIEDALVEIYGEAEGRPPAEDVRTAMAKARVRAKHPELDADYRRLTTEIKAARIWISNQKAVLSAKQSVLNGARAIGA